MKIALLAMMAAALGLLFSCKGVDAVLEWKIEVPKAKKVLVDISERSLYYAQKVDELDTNKDGAIDVWELFRGLMLLVKKD
jgi:hypothetical protein